MGDTPVVLALVVLGGLIALVGALYAIAHWRAWDPDWARAGRHTMAEAGWRVSATWAEFVDWVRLGR